MSDERFLAWATGWTNYALGANLSADWTHVTHALGPATGDAWDVVSLGDHGRLTLTFDAPIVNGPGYDFAVFGNSFNHHFLELAYVEVSSDGTNFFRFHNESLSDNPVHFWGAYMDPTLIDGLAGKYKVGYGMPFDLDELTHHDPLLDVHDVRFVRLIDIVGDGSCFDSMGRVIYDPYPTSGSAGFDLEAVGVLNQWTPLHAWRVEHFGDEAYSPEATNDADWSGDGIRNLLAYALNLDPTIMHVGPLLEFVWEDDESGRRLELEYRRRAGFTNVHVTLTGSLPTAEWTNGPTSLKERVLEQGENGAPDIIRVTPNGTWSNAGSLFFRLEVGEP